MQRNELSIKIADEAVLQHRKPVVEIQNNLRNDVRIHVWYNPTNDKVMIAVYHPSELAGEIIQSGKSDYVKPVTSSARNTAAENCCTKCGSEKYKKSGFAYGRLGKKQRFCCLICHHYFTR